MTGSSKLSPGSVIFRPDAPTCDRLLKTAGGDALIKRAETALSAVPVDPNKSYGVTTGAYAARNKGFLPRAVGIPLQRNMEDLGYAYVLTKDKKYARKAIDYLVTTCRNFPVTHPSIQEGMAGARSHQAWGIALGLLFFGNEMTEDEYRQVAETGRGFAEDFIKVFGNPDFEAYRIANWNALTGAPAGIIALLTGEKEQLGKIVPMLEAWMDDGFDAQGMYVEGHGYAQYGASPRLLLFAWLLKENRGKDLFKHPKFSLWPHSYVAKLIPGSSILDTRGDNDYTTGGAEGAFFGVANNDPVAMWFWERSGIKERYFPLVDLLLARHPDMKGELDFSKKPLSMLFSQREYANWRTGWGEDDVMFSIESGPYARSSSGKGVTHSQSDKGHFCLYAFGDLWAVDSGYANDADHPQSRSHSKAHNLVLLDGQGQALPRVSGKMSKYFDHADFGFSRSDLSSAYCSNDHLKNGAIVKIADRQTLFARPSHGVPAYAVVLDDVYKDAEKHLYTWNFISPTDKKIVLRKDGFVMSRLDPATECLTTPLANQAGSAIWSFSLAKPGKYSLFARLNAAGAVKAKSDSFLIALDKNEPARFDFEEETGFVWRQYTISSVPHSLSPVPPKPVWYEMDSGEHTFTLASREKEAECGGIMLCEEGASPMDDHPGNRVLLTPSGAKRSGGMVLKKIEEQNARRDRMVVKLDASSSLNLSKHLYSPPNPRKPSELIRIAGDARCVSPAFAAVLLPLKEGIGEPKVAFDRTHGVRITIDWGRVTDSISWIVPGDGTPSQNATFFRSLGK
jgi:hypothetical protein